MYLYKFFLVETGALYATIRFIMIIFLVRFRYSVLDEAMIRCSNHDCPLGMWYHMSCVELTELPGKCEDWWCSSDCKSVKSSILCCCKLVKEEQRVVCAGGDECDDGMEFHLPCVNLDGVPGTFFTH